jgi:hypothetical protein
MSPRSTHAALTNCLTGDLYCRYVDPGGPLPRYNWLESYCRLLAQHVANGAFATEAFEVCAALIGGRFAIITSRHLLVVTPTHVHETREAEVTLVVAVESTLHASSAGTYLEVAHLSPATVAECALSATAAILTHMPSTGSSPILPLAAAPIAANVSSSRVSQQYSAAASGQHQGGQAAQNQVPAEAQELCTAAPAAHTAVIEPPPEPDVGLHDAAADSTTSSKATGLFGWLGSWGRGQEAAHQASSASTGTVQLEEPIPAPPLVSSSAAAHSDASIASQGALDTSFHRGGAGSAAVGAPAVPATATPPCRGSTSGGRGSAHLDLARTLSGSSVAGWFGITRLQVVDEGAAAEMAASLQGLVKAYEHQSCLGSSLLLGFET